MLCTTVLQTFFGVPHTNKTLKVTGMCSTQYTGFVQGWNLSNNKKIEKFLKSEKLTTLAITHGQSQIEDPRAATFAAKNISYKYFNFMKLLV